MPLRSTHWLGRPPLHGPSTGDVVLGPARVSSPLHRPCFALSLLVATPGALALAREHVVDILALLRCQRSGDWGVVGRDDTPGGRLWVITEADRSATTVLLPSEY